jgi:prepilin-type processing-associated H-X9-DG protein
LGLGNVRYLAVSSHPQLKPITESQVRVPADMFAISDTRHLRMRNNLDSNENLMGWVHMWPISFYDRYEDPKFRTIHRNAFNVLFCDGHVASVPRRDYTDPKRTARNWNNDHEPHPETWRMP